MEQASTPKQILIVAYRTAATIPLRDAVRQRARREPSEFTLLVPRDPVDDPDTESPARALEIALPLIEDAAGASVEGRLGDSDPLLAIREVAGERRFDEVIISTLPERVSRWLRRDLPRRVREELGLPVTQVVADRPTVFPARIGYFDA
jgi:hypothetical protein